MGDRITLWSNCPKCGGSVEYYDAPSSLMYSGHCDKCGWSDPHDYYEDKDGVTIHLLTKSEARKIAKQLYNPPNPNKKSSEEN